ncbi:MAG: 2Fe-2S iron-sulfur cluster-binding protein [Rhodospirillales bacterium]|nr:2Fe-2S iron-sulfur cluster-binding protein [Rhodospirillales bacterium]
MLELEIWRGGAIGRFQTYRIPTREAQTVLDAVSEVQRTEAPTLAYRFACRVGMCGSCAMMVNDRPRWTCRTRVAVAAPDGRLRLAPLRHFPVVKDLVVDMAPFFAKWQRAHGRFEPGPAPATEFATVPPSTPERRAADAGIECINCGVCYAACDVVGWNPDYLGPAALNRAWTLVNDVRDRARAAARLAAVTGPGGCQSCHTHMACTETCPKAIAPTYAIAGLKRQAMRAALAGTR